MKTSTVVLLGLGALALYYFGNLGIAANVLQYYIQSVNFTGLTTGSITLVVQNPSGTSIMLNSMAGTIAVNGTYIGNISNFQGGIEIGANSQQAVTIQVILSLGSIVEGVVQALTNPTGTNPLNFVISGNANIGFGTIVPFNITQTVNV